jgi:hypothetical protein
MIPDSKILRKKCRKQKLKFREGTYFKDADELVTLESKLIYETFLDKTILMMDMFLYPLYVLIQLCMMNFSISFIFGLMKSYEVWVDWFRREELREEVAEWVRIVKSVNGPWISCSSPEFHVFVYADGMERINMALKKNSKLT